jgi:hypothetical protein
MGIFSGLMGDKEDAKKIQKKLEQAQSIIRSYGPVLEEKGQKQLYVSDESKLPYPKEQIKKAIFIALIVSDDPDTREMLKTGYLSLCLWQMGVGEKDVMYSFDPDIVNINDSPEKIVQDLREAEKEMDSSWLRIINHDRHSLKQDLETLERLAK